MYRCVFVTKTLNLFQDEKNPNALNAGILLMTKKSRPKGENSNFFLQKRTPSLEIFRSVCL